VLGLVKLKIIFISLCLSNAASNAIGYAKFFSRSHNALVRVYDETGNVIETHEHAGV